MRKGELMSMVFEIYPRLLCACENDEEAHSMKTLSALAKLYDCSDGCNGDSSTAPLPAKIDNAIKVAKMLPKVCKGIVYTDKINIDEFGGISFDVTFEDGAWSTADKITFSVGLLQSWYTVYLKNGATVESHSCNMDDFITEMTVFLPKLLKPE